MSAATAASDVILPKHFDISKLTYGQPKQQSTGAKTIFIGYGGKQCYIQTPVMKTPFGVSVWPSDNGGPDKYSLDLSFEGCDVNPQMQAFFDALLAVDKRLVTDAMENSQAWFKKKYPSVDVVEALYTPTVKYGKDKETGEISTRYAPTFKMSLPLKDGRFQFPAFGGNREELDIFDIAATGRSKGARAQAIVQLSAVWIVGTKFGLMWKVRQLKLTEAARLGNAYAFQKTEDDDDEDDAEPATPAPASRKAGAGSGSGAGAGKAPAAARAAAAQPSSGRNLVQSSDDEAEPAGPAIKVKEV